MPWWLWALAGWVVLVWLLCLGASRWERKVHEDEGWDRGDFF
jgi:hypothetical protein